MKYKHRRRQGTAQCGHPARARTVTLWSPLLSESPSGTCPALLAGFHANIPATALSSPASLQEGWGQGWVRLRQLRKTQPQPWFRNRMSALHAKCWQRQCLNRVDGVFSYSAHLVAAAVIALEWELVWLI